MSLTKVSYSMIEGTPINVLDYGVDNTGTTNNATALQSIIDNAPVGASIYFPAGTYLGYMYIWRSDLSIIGAGSSSTIIKLADNTPEVTVPHEGGGTVTGVPNVIEIGECALGNEANEYTNITIKGITVDGNWENQTAPTTDLFGHGIEVTKTSYCTFYDIVAKNCMMTGFSNVINSNYNHCSVTVIDCGNVEVYGGHYPNFDINSSKYSQYSVISKGGYYGARVLDNCWGSFGSFSIYAPVYTGFVYNNQSVNYSYANTFIVNVYDGCDLGQGVSIGSNCKDSTITANIYGVTGAGFIIGAVSDATAPTGNTIISNTSNCGGTGFYDNQYSAYNNYTINSSLDGRTGSPGDQFAVSIYGHNNIISVTIREGLTSQVRGLFLENNSNDNQVIGLMLDSNLYEAYNNLGNNNYVNWGQGIPASIASANTITLPTYGSFMNITGTTNIISITGPGSLDGRMITLFFNDSLTVSGSGGGNIKLAGGLNFSATGGDTLTLASNGSYWYEIARSAN